MPRFGHARISYFPKADHEIQTEVIIEAENDVWTMTRTFQEDGVKTSKVITGTKEEVMSAANNIGIAAMGQIDKK